ncbi:MAG: lysophospholipid acyltransferase family protein [Acidihalobacter sp.]|jgi:1-acyl-sn-glycerol-3-phosphate acyltransferase|uniref:lysophospholipid acyltransferase family protein n=1 Tax=Acidihalobacter sp. TaxID=1872108 RepID=UPI00307F3576
MRRDRSLWPMHEQPNIIVANHTSLLDGPALAWLTPWPILFSVDSAYARHPVWSKVLLGYARLIGTGCEMVPMMPGSAQGLRTLARRLEEGGWVCLFPEGGIGTGQSYPGVDWLAGCTSAPVHRLHISTIGFGKYRWPYRIESDLLG